MADKKISEFVAVTSVNSNDELPIVQAGETKKTSVTNLLSSVSTQLPDQQVNTVSNPTFNSIKFNPVPTIGTTETGQLYFDQSDQTLSLDVGNSVLQIGQEQYVRARNNTGATITNGSVVYISGASGNKPLITKAIATTEVAAFGTIGVATEDIANSQVGNITVAGVVRGIDTSSFAGGSVLYLSASTAGGLTATKPVYPNFEIEVARVMTSDTVNGEILVSVRANKSAILESTKANKDGTNATGTWAIDISGNAATASVASTANDIVNDAVTTAKIATSAVTDTKIASNAVTTAKIVNNNITLAKLARVGTSGQVLTSQGTGADPIYQDLPPSGVTASQHQNGCCDAGFCGCDDSAWVYAGVHGCRLMWCRCDSR